MMLSMRNRLPLTIGATVLAAALLLGACSDDQGGGAADGRVEVAASFYPLQWVAERVGGEHVDVRSLTKPGAEPHDLELTPTDVARLSKADLVVYLHGFQPAVDEALTQADRSAVVDAAPAAGLDLRISSLEGDAAGAVDPHFWLDPTKLALVAGAVAERLEAVDPDHRADYAANAQALTAELTALDGRLREGLSVCTSTELVTSHQAFGYLARRYGLQQIGITGLTPEQEPSPADLAAVAGYVREHHVTTIWFETLASPDVAKTIASETGATTAVLDPIEGLTDESAGRDYLSVMDANLAALRQGLGCS